MKANASRLQEIMRRNGIDVLVVSSPANVFYLSDVPTNFTSTNRLLFCVKQYSPVICVVPSTGELTIILSASALEVVRKHTWIEDLRLYESGTYIRRPKILNTSGSEARTVLARAIRDKSSSNKSIAIGIEFNDLSVQSYQSLLKDVPNSVLSDASSLLMESRMIKNEEEIRRFRKATDILCKTMHKIEDACKDRPTEVELDILLKTEMMKLGAESWQQTTIAAGKISGPDISNQPVANRRIKTGDVIRLDVGCVYKGYCADLARTFAVGRIPSFAKKPYDVIKDAYMKYLGELKPGIRASRINRLAVDYVRKNLDKDYYRGYVGHGVGVEVYDRPFLSPQDQTILQPGMTLSYEVPYHIFGFCGLNLEDSILINKKGNNMVSNFDRDLIVV